MGRLNPSCLDTILTCKLKILVNGAIERQKLESNTQSESSGDHVEPTITYDRFVDDLSVRDSFTATLVELLVKEVAERQTRPSVGIGESTRRTLRRLADHYSERPRRTASIRSARLTEQLSYPPSEANELENDHADYENMLDSNAIEGARIDTHLYDTYSSPENSWPLNTTISSTNRDDSPPFLPLPRSPTTVTAGRLPTWVPVPARSTVITNSSSLARPSSVRRPLRASARTSDFREFTSQRRSVSRQATDDDDAQATSRRVFSYNIGHRLARYDEGLPQNLPTPSASSPSPPPQSTPDGTEPEPVFRPPPRLRRGGLRAPEAMVSWSASRETSPGETILITNHSD